MAYRIALFLRGNEDYQEALRDECVASARRYRFDLRVFTTNNDVPMQVSQIDECLTAHESVRPNVLLVHPVHEFALVSAARAAARLGVGWVLLNRWNDSLTNLRLEFPSLPIFCVSPDQYDVGRIQGQQFRCLLPRGGELVYIRGPLGTSSTARRYEGAHEALQGSPIQVFSLHSDWTSRGGEQSMKEWMQVFQGRGFPKFMVGAQNDAMAIGARRAFEEAMKGQPGDARDVYFTGCDGSQSFGRRLVNEGELTATVVIPLTTGRAVSELASMLGGGPRPPAAITLPVSSFPDLSDLSVLTQGNERKAAASNRPRVMPTQRPTQRPSIKPVEKK